jgi:hypothetical protein
MLGNIKVAIVISILMVIVGIIIESIQSRKPKLDELYNTQETEELRF